MHTGQHLLHLLHLLEKKCVAWEIFVVFGRFLYSFEIFVRFWQLRFFEEEEEGCTLHAGRHLLDLFSGQRKSLPIHPLALRMAEGRDGMLQKQLLDTASLMMLVFFF